MRIFHFYPALFKVIGTWLLFGLDSIFFYGLQEDSDTVINTGYNQHSITVAQAITFMRSFSGNCPLPCKAYCRHRILILGIGPGN